MKRKCNKKSRKQPKKTETGDKNTTPFFKEVVDFYQVGRVGEAFSSCHRITENYPDSAQAWHLLGLLAFQEGKINDAVKYMRKAVYLKSDYAAAWNDLGNVFSEISHMEEAENAYRRSIRLDPGTTMSGRYLIILPASTLKKCRNLIIRGPDS